MPDTMHISAAIVNKEKKFLVINVKEKPGQNPFLWTLPGGKAKSDEKVLEVLSREIREECGLEIKPQFDFLWNYEFEYPDGRKAKGFCFRVWPTTSEVKLEKGRRSSAWIGVEDLETHEMALDFAEKIRENSWKWLKRPGE